MEARTPEHIKRRGVMLSETEIVEMHMAAQALRARLMGTGIEVAPPPRLTVLLMRSAGSIFEDQTSGRATPAFSSPSF